MAIDYPSPPAVAQPEPEAVGPSDEDAVEAAAELIYAEAMEWAARQPIPHGSINIPAWQQGGNSDAQDVARRTARAAIARWGRPAPPAEGEVAELVALIRQIALAWEPDACLLGNMTAGQLARAADLLERQAAPVPVPVSDRLPGAEDCDAEGQCWQWDGPSDAWVLYTKNGMSIRWQQGVVDYWLPAHALPLPSGEVEA